MFGFFKALLRRPQPAAAEITTQVNRQPSAAPKATSFTASPASPVQHNGKGVHVPLGSILASLPLELQPRVQHKEVGELAISVPLEKILAQLSRGMVKISFGELRQWAPEVFSQEDDRDRVLVALPLGEILPRLNPALIQRRRAQKHVEVPQEISSPFDPTGPGLLNPPAPGSTEVKPKLPPARQVAPPPVSEPAPEPIPFSSRAPETKPASPKAPAITRGSITSTPTPQPPAGPALPTAVPSPARPPMVKLSGNGAKPPAHPPTNGGANGKNGEAGHRVQPSVPKEPAAAPQAPKNGSSEALSVGITSLAESWPEAVRKEIVTLKLVDAKVALPMDAIEQALRQGRIIFTWKTLRAWIKPSPLPAVSAHDNLALELPLRLVAPLFLERQKQLQKPQQKVSIDEDIPNLFFGFPQPEVEGEANGAKPGVSPGARPADTNYYVWDDSGDTVRLHESEVQQGPSPGTRFTTKYATPNEVVSRAASLDGVAGVLIALPDGLMVANRLPSDINGDTLAAFLPQIFGKVSTCIKELRMGELNNLHFTVGNVPWKIFRVNAIFFAAFGTTGKPLPSAQLAALAAELDHKPK